MVKRNIDLSMIESLRDAYVKDTGLFYKMLFLLKCIDGVSKSDIARVERLVKSEMFEQKLLYLANQYLTNNSILTKLKIHQDLIKMSINPLTFLLMVDEIKENHHAKTLAQNP